MPPTYDVIVAGPGGTGGAGLIAALTAATLTAVLTSAPAA